MHSTCACFLRFIANWMRFYDIDIEKFEKTLDQFRIFFWN